jgi:hypothetical protein
LGEIIQKGFPKAVNVEFLQVGPRAARKRNPNVCAMMGLQLLDKLKNMLEIAKVYDILAQPNNFDIVLWYYFPNQ